jgi:Conserved hypothetical protein (DUF2461)
LVLSWAVDEHGKVVRTRGVEEMQCHRVESIWKKIERHGYYASLANLCITTVHDPDYRTSWNDWSTFVESLTEKIAEKDETIPELPPKDLVFRIYRDIRFSSDPTPYKVRVTQVVSCGI